MKAAIRYYSRGGNTEKLAKAIGEAAGLEALTTEHPLTEDTDKAEAPDYEKFAEDIPLGFKMLGYGLAMVLFAGLREQMAQNDVPESFKGLPIAFITVGIMAMAFLGFSGIV